MRRSVFALAFLISTNYSFAQDANAIREKAKLLGPERDSLIACLSDVVDVAKTTHMTSDEFKGTLAKSCAGQREEFRKAFLDRIIPALKGTDEGEKQSVWATQLFFIPMLNEFSGQVPYRYRLKDAEKAMTPTPEDIAFRSAKEKYSECLSNVATNLKASGASPEDVKKSLDNVCLEEAEVVRQTELRVWETYARPPTNRDAAGKVAIRIAKDATVRQYNQTAK